MKEENVLHLAHVRFHQVSRAEIRDFLIEPASNFFAFFALNIHRIFLEWLLCREYVRVYSKVGGGGGGGTMRTRQRFISWLSVQLVTWKFRRGRGKWGRNSPRYPAALHVVRQGDVVAPDVELPLPQTENPAMNSARVYSYSHVHVHRAHLSIQSSNVEQMYQLPTWRTFATEWRAPTCLYIYIYFAKDQCHFQTYRFFFFFFFFCEKKYSISIRLKI